MTGKNVEIRCVDDTMLAREIEAAADEFNRLSELASTRGVLVQAEVITVKMVEDRYQRSFLKASVFKKI